jgi:hypothetical protein
MKVVPLKASFMIISIVGFLLSVYLVDNVWPQMAFAFATVFVLMFIAALISMSKVPIK